MSFLRNLSLIIACWGYSLMRGRANNYVDVVPKRIAIMPASRLGDMICATPIFRAIKKKFPECHVFVLGTENCAYIHENNKDVDRYIVLEEKGVMENMKRIQELRADVAIVTTPSFEAIATYFLAAISTIIGPNVVNGFCPYQTKSYRLLMPLFMPIEHRMKYYAPREYLRMLEPLGINSEDTSKHLFFSENARLKANNFFSSHSLDTNTDFIVGISVSAGNKIKRWQEYKFTELTNWLSKDLNATVIFIGNNPEETNAVVEKLDKGTRFVDTTGMFNIDELKALMSKLKMFIAVDTGPIYVAEAFGVPTVDITGPIDPNEQPPIGRLNKVVHIADRKEPQLYVMNARVYDKNEALRQTEGITVEMVKNAVLELYEAISYKP